MEKILVQRANVILEVDADDKEYYKGQGFNVIDSSGNVIEAVLPNDPGELKVMVGEQKAKIERLEQEQTNLIAELNKVRDELKKLQAKNKKSSSSKKEA